MLKQHIYSINVNIYIILQKNNKIVNDVKNGKINTKKCKDLKFFNNYNNIEKQITF